MQNPLYFRSIGDHLLEEASGAKKVFLCSPFVKVSALNKVLAGIDSEAEITLVTKIDLHSFVCGTSDISALGDVLSKNGRVLILANLHLKYYRFNYSVFLGSANLTQKGLGWAHEPNVELLVKRTFGEMESLLEEVISESAIILDYESLGKFESLLKEYLEHYNAQKEQKYLDTINQELRVALSGYIAKVQNARSDQIQKWVPQDIYSIEQLYHSHSCAVRDADLPEDLANLGFHAGTVSRDIFLDQLKRKIRKTGIYQEIVNIFDQTTEERPFLSFGFIRECLAKYLDSDRETANHQVNLIYEWFTAYLPDEFFEPQPMTYSRLLGRTQTTKWRGF